MQSGMIVEQRWKLNTEPKPLAWRRSLICALTAIAIVGLTISLTSPARAANMVTNPGFSTTTPTITVSTQFGALCCNPRAMNPLGPGAVNPVVNGWTASGIAIIYLPSTGTNPSGTTADQMGGSGGAVTQFCSSQTSTCPQASRFRLWGPGTGSANGLTLSPNGGNFIALDGDPSIGSPPGSQGEISQVISGLTPGLGYHISFFWAGAQQSGFNGDTFEQLRVSLCPTGGNPGSGVPLQPAGPGGTCGFFTNVVDNASHGFTGWMPTTITLDATSTVETLDFLALGAPQGLPPLVLLDGVSVTPVPEPATWSLIVMGFAVITLVGYRRAKRASVPA